MTDTWRYNPQPPQPAWGVQAPTAKAASTAAPIRLAPLPSRATVSMARVAGPVLRPLVTPGQRVHTGEPVARGDDGAQVHAPVSGDVLAVGPAPVPGATPGTAPCVTIRSDDADTWHHGCRAAGDPLAAEPAALRERIAAGGIVGLGGALYPTARKLAAGAPIRALILDGAECEPWITCDDMLLRERADRVVRGARLLLHVLRCAHGVIAVKTDMPEARVALDDALRAAGDARLGLAVVTARYPAGGERQLVELLTGDEVPAGGLPLDIGYVCHNVATAAAVAALLDEGRPLVSRVVTVTGDGIAEPGNFEVRIGTPIADLVAAAGGYRGQPRRLVMGGPMMGWALPDDALPVTPATNCVAATGAVPARPERACIRCGDCVQACPARLQPHELLAAARAGDAERLAELAVGACIECGACDYVCPSLIPLTVTLAAAKARTGPARASGARDGRG